MIDRALWLVVAMLVAMTAGQRAFTASFTMTGSSLVNGGVVNGRMFYNYDSHSLFLNFPFFNYGELYLYNSAGGVSGNYDQQYLHRISAKCSGKCETSDLRAPCPKIFPDPTVYRQSSKTATILGQTCNKWLPLDPTYPVTEAWFTSSGVVCQLSTDDGRTLTFSSNDFTPPDPSVFTAPTDCKCGQEINIILVLDGSASINTTDWAQVNQFVKSFALSFEYGPLATGLGIIQFSTGAQNELVLTTSLIDVQTKVASSMRQLRASTCITCGLSAAVNMLLGSQNRSATPIIIIVTDGAHNVLRYTGVCRTPECDLVYGMNMLRSTLPTAVTYAVGVGTEIVPSQLLILAMNKSENYYTFNSFTHFQENFAKLATRACDVTNTTRCGTCCGFCICGACTSPENCDDGDPCTVDPGVDPNTGCCAPSYPKCTDPDKCTIASCDSTTGYCSQTPRVCPHQTCKNESCVPSLGCQYIDKCVDKDACTPRVCNNDVCVDSPKDCGKSDACTIRACDPKTGYCTLTDLTPQCDDENPCTIDSCDPNSLQTPGCVHTPVECFPSNLCYHDAVCNVTTGGCTQTPVVCDDHNACTTDYCNIEFGCSNIPVTCPATGVNFCWVLDICDEILGCRYKQKVCDDGNPNTYDFCDVTDGSCINQQIPCADYASVCANMSNKCYTYRCSLNVDEPDNCANLTIVNCDDDNKCTNEHCDNSTGCVVSAVNCTAGPCQTVKCDPKLGCVYTNIDCNDQNPCTQDTCNPTTNRCEYSNICTQTTDKCTERWCEFGQCREFPLCLISPDPCFVTTPCNQTSGCGFVPKCTSEDPCILASCVNGSCVNTPKSCDDSNACTNEICDKGKCVYSPVKCDDSNACTVDTCDPKSGCHHTPLVPKVDCNDYNACTRDECYPEVGCVNVNITSQCSDGNNCTIDTCDPVHGCVYTERVCPSSNCEIGYCRLGQCYVTKSGCIPPSIVVVTVGGGVGILVAIVIAIIVCVCGVAHGGAYYHGLYGVAAKHFGYGAGDAVSKQAYGAEADYTKQSTSAAKGDNYVELKTGYST